jgi:glycerate kinase
LGDGVTGVVEIASASGLHLVPSAKRDPMVTTTYGTGELIKAALDRGIKKLIIGLGGSGTNDGGVGMVQALGVRFMDKDGSEIGRGGGELIKIAVIDTSRLEAALRSVRVEIACDVTNPLTGENGASRVFGPQKGATGEAIMELDRNLEHLAGKIKEYMGKDIKHVPGTGAAGGSGAGLMAFLDAKLVQGIDVIMEHSGLEEKMKSADYVFTGEGSLDRQTLYGKTISGVINLSRRYDIPVVAFAGRVSHADILYQSGLAAVFSILPSVCTLEEALKNGEENLETTVYSVVRLMNAGIKK